MRDLSHIIRSGMRTRLVNNFDRGAVGLSTLPAIQERITARTTEPYIYLRSESTLEIDKTKDGVPREYATLIEVVTSYPTGQGGPRLRDLIADQVTDILTREEMDYPGVNVYIQTIDSTASFTYDTENKTFFKTNITVLTRAIEEEVAAGNLPVQLPVYTPTAFMFTPTMNRIELFDTGRIVPQATYPSNNNGYNFDSVTYTLGGTSGGTISTAGVVTVDGDDEVSIVSEIEYQSITDNTDLQTLTATTNFSRIRSVRYGVISTTTVDLTTLTSDVQYGTISPVGVEANFVLDQGERAYIAYDADEADLIGINQLGFAVDISNQFTMTTANGFKVYTQNDAWNYSDPATLIVRLA